MTATATSRNAADVDQYTEREIARTCAGLTRWARRNRAIESLLHLVPLMTVDEVNVLVNPEYNAEAWEIWEAHNAGLPLTIGLRDYTPPSVGLPAAA